MYVRDVSVCALFSFVSSSSSRGAVGDPSLARGDIDERFAAARAKRDRSRDLRRSATHASHPVAPSIPYFRSRSERRVFVTPDFHKFFCWGGKKKPLSARIFNLARNVLRYIVDTRDYV